MFQGRALTRASIAVRRRVGTPVCGKFHRHPPMASPIRKYAGAMATGKCPICSKVGTLTREHVWPNWFLQRMDEHGAPPYGWSVNGKPLLTRGGIQIKGARRQRVMLAICYSCNQSMNQGIEVPAKPVVETLALNKWRGEYGRDEWQAVGRWWAKVLLLTGHPESALENGRLQGLVRWDFETTPQVEWLGSAEGGVPDHVSVFVHRADYLKSRPRHELVLPAKVLLADGISADCHVLSLATPGIAVAVVSHPGITVNHPLVEAGHAWELLHSPPARGNLDHLKAFPRDTVRFVRGGGVPEGHVVDGSEIARLTAIFGYEPDQDSVLGQRTPTRAARAGSWLRRLRWRRG